MESHTFEIACDAPEAAEFAAWLNDRGHEAVVGRTTGNYVDGDCTSHDDDARGVMNLMWEMYCNA